MDHCQTRCNGDGPVEFRHPQGGPSSRRRSVPGEQIDVSPRFDLVGHLAVL